MPKMHRAPTQPMPTPGKSKSGGKAWIGVGVGLLIALILGGLAFAGFKVFGPQNNPTPTEESTSEPNISGGQTNATPSATPPIAGVQKDPCGDGVCTPGKEDNASCPKDCPPVSQGPYCGSVCASDADCTGLGVNPACAGGYCYDAQTCGGATTSGDSGGSSGGGSSGGTGAGPACSRTHCGNTLCEPWCGEDVASCPRDC